MNSVCASVDFVLNSIGLLWCNGSERQLRQGATKKRDNWRPAEVGDGTRDTRAKNRDVPPKVGRVVTLARTHQHRIEKVFTERRLSWLGHVTWNYQWISWQALYWEVLGFGRRPGQSRAKWRGRVTKRLRRMELTWEGKAVAALSWQEWHHSVIYYVHMDTAESRIQDTRQRQTFAAIMAAKKLDL